MCLATGRLNISEWDIYMEKCMIKGSYSRTDFKMDTFAL